jgi:TIR domain
VITPKVESWLLDSGYQYFSFISYPGVSDPWLKDCARVIKETISQRLSQIVKHTAVFLDEDMKPGTEWDPHIRAALCRSVTMVALCCPMFYRKEHRWCGLEWATMDVLFQRRLPHVTFHGIVPIILRDKEALPPPVQKINYLDISREFNAWKHYQKTKAFANLVAEVVNRIVSTALELEKGQAKSCCESFNFPVVSAFDIYDPPDPLSPQWGGTT